MITFITNGMLVVWRHISFLHVKCEPRDGKKLGEIKWNILNAVGICRAFLWKLWTQSLRTDCASSVVRTEASEGKQQS
jgi:hypothetical protein